MRYNTRNPVGPDGSSSPFDLHDNAGALDLLLNGPLGEYLNRLGVPLKSWLGIMQQVTDYLIAQGYESVYLVYGAGVVVQRQTQLVQRSGELYRVMNASDIPLTLTGTWATDAPKLQAVGDAALRQVLALPGGAALVRTLSHGTVEEAVDELFLPASPTQLGRTKIISPSSAQSGQDADAAITGAGLRAYDRALLSLRNTFNSWLSTASITGARTMNVLGDSISFGAGSGTTQGDVRRHGWVRILQRALNIESGGNNYGFVSAYESNGSGREIHTVTQVPAVPEQYWGALQDAAAGHLPNGWALLSSQAGDAVRFAIVSEFRQVRIWFDGTQVGSFRVNLGDGTLLTTVTTNGSGTGLDRTIALTVNDWANGGSRIDITVISGTVAISGIEYSQDVTNFSINNFSRDGRKIQYIAEAVIQRSCNGAGALIFALGANDQLSVGADQTAVIQRMDWLIQYANQYSCRLVIIDFLMWQSDSHWLRSQFRRVAAAVPGSLLVPLANLISPSGMPLTAAQLNARNITSDGTHLTQQGNRMVSEAIASMMGLSVTSKGLGNRLSNSWQAIPLVGGVTNSTSDVRAITGWRRNNNTLELRFNCSCPASGTLIGTVPLGFAQIAMTGNYSLNPASDGKAALIAINATGELRVFNDPGRSLGLPATLVGSLVIPLLGNNEFPIYY